MTNYKNSENFISQQQRNRKYSKDKLLLQLFFYFDKIDLNQKKSLKKT